MFTLEAVAADITSSDRAWSLLIDTYATLMPRFEAEMQREVGISLSWFDVTANLITAPDRRLSKVIFSDDLPVPSDHDKPFVEVQRIQECQKR